MKIEGTKKGDGATENSEAFFVEKRLIQQLIGESA